VIYLLAFFVSPLALLFAGAPFAALFNALVYGAAWLATPFIVPGVILWAIGVGHALVVINNKRADRRTRRIIDAIRENQPPPRA
jgi:hypothetical protein